MARNEEKAQALLNRFVTAKRDANRPDKSQRPYLASECDNVPDCELYRNQILKEISKKVSLIQNEGLDEHRVRDLNDSINKLSREKGHWERQIKALGGPDYFRTAPKLFADEDGSEVVPGKGYRYFGAAKKLPGVRELFKKAPPDRAKRTRFEMMKGIDADYYGYRDDDDGILARAEAAAEPAHREALMAEWEKAKAARHAADPDAAASEQQEEDAAAEEEVARFVAHVEVPDQEAIKAAVLARRKREMLAKLEGAAASEDFGPELEGAGGKPLVPPSW